MIIVSFINYSLPIMNVRTGMMLELIVNLLIVKLLLSAQLLKELYSTN